MQVLTAVLPLRRGCGQGAAGMAPPGCPHGWGPVAAGLCGRPQQGGGWVCLARGKAPCGGTVAFGTGMRRTWWSRGRRALGAGLTFSSPQHQGPGQGLHSASGTGVPPQLVPAGAGGSGPRTEFQPEPRRAAGRSRGPCAKMSECTGAGPSGRGPPAAQSAAAPLLPGGVGLEAGAPLGAGSAARAGHGGAGQGGSRGLDASQEHRNPAKPPWSSPAHEAAVRCCS